MALENLVLQLMETKWLKRLEGISLTDVPSNLLRKNVSSRLEHCLGIYKLGKLVVEKNDLPEEIAIACLLHDVGHAPFGHLSDLFVRIDEFGKDHEIFGSQLIKGDAPEIQELLEKYGLDSQLVAEIIENKSMYSQFLHNPIDLDCLENIHRLYVEALYPIFKAEPYNPYKIANSYRFLNGKIHLNAECLKEVEKHVELRGIVYNWLWKDENLRLWGMLGKALDIAYECGSISEGFFLMENGEALKYLRNLEPTREIMRKIERGELFHTVLRKILFNYPNVTFIPRRKRIEIENEIGDGVICIVGSPPIRKKIDIPFNSEPNFSFNNENIYPLYFVVYCEKKRLIEEYRRRAIKICENLSDF